MAALICDVCVRFRAGVCVPQECGLSDVPALLNPLLQHVSNGTVPPLTLDNLMGQCGAFHFKATPSTSHSTRSYHTHRAWLMLLPWWCVFGVQRRT